MKTRFLAATACAAVLVAALRARSQSPSSQSPTPERRNPNATRAATAPSATARNAGFIDAVDEAEIEDGQAAVRTSKNPAVLAFARQMVDAHGENRRKLATSGVQAADGPDATALKREHKAQAARLAKLKGASFDRAYAALQESNHAAVLSKLDKRIVPQETTGPLGAFVQETRQAVEMHLKAARELKASLK
jgi:putative membrane protein